MKITEIQGKSADELNTLLTERKKEAFNLRFQKTSGELANTSRVREVRRDIAKINTLLTKLSATAKPKKAKTKAA